MNRWTVLLVAIMCTLFAAMGCSSGGGSPVTPTADLGITDQVMHAGQTNTQTHLWGFYEVYMDLESMTVEAVPVRGAMFAANVVTFVNGNPSNLQFTIHSTTPGASWMDVLITVAITHPFSGLPVYDGYDVRGVFIGDGSRTMDYGSGLRHPVWGADQMMTLGNADGYTRWYNAGEFRTPGLAGYTPGLFASSGYTGNATLNGYKYFANGLSPTGDVWDFLTSTTGNGKFASGATNQRQYNLRFPNSKGVKYNYAIVANWEGEDPGSHPSNAVEAVGCSVDVEDNVYYVDDGDWGGELRLDISVFNWADQPVQIYLESEMIDGAYEFSAPEMTPVGGSGNVSTYHVEMPVTELEGNDGNEYWVVCEYDDDYRSEITPPAPGSAPAGDLAAFFRYDLFVADERYNAPPIIDSGIDGNIHPIEFTSETYTVTVTEPDGDPVTYSWTLYDGDDVPVDGYDGVEGDGAGSLDVDFDALCGLTSGTVPFYLTCTVSDAEFDVDATPLDINYWVEADLYVSNNPDFDDVPDNGTYTEPYSTISQAITAHTSGDIIVVDYGTGTYSEQVYANYSTGFTLRGWSWYTIPWGRPEISYQPDRPVYIYYTDNVTIRGFTIAYATGSTTNYLAYCYYSDNMEFYNCHFTGTVSYYYMYLLYMYYCDSLTVKNCKFSDLSNNASSSYNYFYMYLYRGNGTHNFIQNEITDIQSTTPLSGYYYLYFYAYYWPAGSNWSNNLIHHIEVQTPQYGTAYPVRVYYPYATVNVDHNVVDNISCDGGPNSMSSRVYGMYLYRSTTSTYGYDGHSNIVTNLNGTYTAPTYYGMYCYNLAPTYNDVWNIQDIPYGYAFGGAGSISADPLFVENDTEPYDYTLDTGSPCIGTGKNSTDMGCYGDLATGEVIGLVTPE